MAEGMEAVSTSAVIDTDYIAYEGKRIDEIPFYQKKH